MPYVVNMSGCRHRHTVGPSRTPPMRNLAQRHHGPLTRDTSHALGGLDEEGLAQMYEADRIAEDHGLNVPTLAERRDPSGRRRTAVWRKLLPEGSLVS
jgi:hypothetical protein